MSAQKEVSRIAIVEITGDSWERLAKDNFAEAERLQALNAELLEALEVLTWGYEVQGEYCFHCGEKTIGISPNETCNHSKDCAYIKALDVIAKARN